MQKTEMKIINELSRNRNVFKEHLSGLTPDIYLWKPDPEKWCILQVVCHLYDEEREDFRARMKHILDTPEKSLPPIDPQNWVTLKKYIEKDYNEVLNKFLFERELSVKWLMDLSDAGWENTYHDPKRGPITARMLFCNWLAHDYIHIRQITKLKYLYFKQLTGEDLNYAGNW